MTEEEHLGYHLEVATTGCGEPGCDFANGIAMHFRALKELSETQPPDPLPEYTGDDTDLDDL